MTESTDNRQYKHKSASFAVQIIHTQNATWQGTVSWVGAKQTVPFRSALELLKLIDSVVSDEEGLPE